MQDLLAEVQTVDADLVLLAFASRAHLASLQHLLRLHVVAARFKSDVSLRFAVEHPEEVVIRTGHDVSETIVMIVNNQDNNDTCQQPRQHQQSVNSVVCDMHKTFIRNFSKM